MTYSQYELHKNYDRDFPLCYHIDSRSASDAFPFFPHWHEHLEVLLILKGVCRVKAGNVTHTLYTGDLILFSPDCPHDIAGAQTNCEYFCITIDRRFCTDFGIPANRGQFSQLQRNGEANKCLLRIIKLLSEKPFCYRQEVKALCLQMLTILYREHDNGESHSTGGNNTMISDAIEYLNAHFAEPISVEEISKYVGFSKYYFCRCFKEVTGLTVVNYINFLRCSNARRLIRSGQYNISESATISGFNNLSYFSRTYTKHIGHPPSDEKLSLNQKSN